MAETSTFNRPNFRETGLFLVGGVIGMFAPGLFISVIGSLTRDQAVGGWISSKLSQMAGTDLASKSATDSIVYALLLLISAIAFDRASSVIKVFIIGIATGILFRIILIYIFGIPVIAVNTDFGQPVNETINQSNSTVQTFQAG